MSNFFLRNLGFPSLKSWFNVLSVLMFKEISRKGKKNFTKNAGLRITPGKFEMCVNVRMAII